MPEPIKEYEKKIKQLEEELVCEKEKTRIAENNNRLNVEKIKKYQKNEKLYKKQISDLKNDIASMEKYTGAKRCEACGELVPETIMCYVGNENVCEECNVNGYAR